jgi:hypothetical protein
MSGLTPALVAEFWQYMMHRYGGSVIDKRNASEMQLVGALLGKLGIVDKDSFLRHYATTIGHRIYIPFEIGLATPDWSLWGQIMVCTHECEHIVQYDNLGPIKFAWQYVAKTAGRARLEAEAYRCQLELHFWRTAQLLSPHELASSLKSYGVTDADIQVAETILRMSAESVRRGAVINPTSRAAIDWLNVHAPELRAKAS